MLAYKMLNIYDRGVLVPDRNSPQMQWKWEDGAGLRWDRLPADS